MEYEKKVKKNEKAAHDATEKHTIRQ